jgi:hypothetical protein
VSGSVRRIRLGIGVVAAVVLAGLLALRQAGAEPALLRILAIGGGLLVTMLFVTYRALANIVAAAKANPDPLPYDEDDEDEDDR